MDTPQLLTDKSIDFLRHLLKHRIKFLIVGNSAALLQGAPVATIDIDLWFEKLGSAELKKTLKEKDISIVTGVGLAIVPPTLIGLGTELFDIVVNPQGLNEFKIEWKNRIYASISGLDVPVLPLDRVIASKRAARREKDLAVLSQLETALKILKAKGR